MCCLAGCCMALRASSVVWGMFTVGTGSVSDPVSGNNVPGIGIRCYCAEEGFAYLMADVGLSYNMQGGRIKSVSSAAFQQTLTGQALFVWAFAGDALTDAYLEQAALVVDYRQGVGIGEAYGDQSMPVNPGDSLYAVLFSTLMPHLFASRSGRLQANHRSRCAKLRGCKISFCIPLTF